MIGQTFSHYRILSRIGEGGMGVVYVAEDLRLGRRVAIKFPLTGTDEQNYRARFLREARAVSALNHPNIAAVYDFGETEDKHPYLVMELVTGQSLSDLLAQGMTLARAVEIIQDVASALAEAHRRGVIHRDIKPTNVLINDRGEVKVLDFGLAKHLDEAALASTPEGQSAFSVRTRSDVVIGTPLYLSPEQARGAAVDARSDLFALGALLYECAAGRPPFSGANVIEIGAQVLHVNPPPPSRHNPRVPADLDRVCLKALGKRPEDRYQTAREMIDALEPVRLRLAGNDAARTRRLATQSVALRQSALTTISASLRRPRFSPLALGAVFALAVVGFWVYLYVSRAPEHVPPEAAARLYQSGAQALRDGAYHRASADLAEAVRIDDDYALAHARLAEAWTELDFLDRAKDEMLRAASLVHDRSVLSRENALYFDAITSTVSRKYPAAVEAYQRLAELHPRSPEVHLDLGRAHEKNDETERAVAAYTAATERDPNYATAYLRLGVLYIRQKNYDAASGSFDHAERLYTAAGNQEGRAEVFYQRGLMLISKGPIAAARRELEQSLEIARGAGNRSQQAQALIQLSVVSSKENNLDQAITDVAAAVEIAQTAGMPNVTARGLDALGSVYFSRGVYLEAEQNYTRALEVARLNRVRRYEARALFNLGSLRLRQNRTAECIEMVEKARDFYQQGGYLKEQEQAILLLGRARRQQADYAGALQIFAERLRLAETTGDMQQIGDANGEVGTVQLLWGRYPEAVGHFGQSSAIFKSLGFRFNVAYALVKQADALWRLGRYDEARAALDEATEFAGRPEGASRDLLAYLYVVESSVALSQRRFDAAAAKARQALAINSQNKEMVAEATRIAGLASLRRGARAEGRGLCEQAAASAGANGEPRFAAFAQLSLAEALLETGDAAGALAEARRALEFFSRSGQTDAQWEASIVAARAALRAGDAEGARAHAARAAELLALLREGWGEEAASGFLARPDVAQLNKESDGLASAAAER